MRALAPALALMVVAEAVSAAAPASAAGTPAAQPAPAAQHAQQAAAQPAQAPAAASVPGATSARGRLASRRLSPAELEGAARAALAASPAGLPKYASLKAVRASAVTELGFAPERVTIEVTAPPRRAGAVTTSAVLSFWRNATTVGARTPVTLELDIPQAALVFDVAKGAPIALAIERGLVVVTTTAVAASDANIGDVIQVLLRPSGRALRARIVAKDRAVATEDAR